MYTGWGSLPDNPVGEKRGESQGTRPAAPHTGTTKDKDMEASWALFPCFKVKGGFPASVLQDPVKAQLHTPLDFFTPLTVISEMPLFLSDCTTSSGFKIKGLPAAACETFCESPGASCASHINARLQCLYLPCFVGFLGTVPGTRLQ